MHETAVRKFYSHVEERRCFSQCESNVNNQIIMIIRICFRIPAIREAKQVERCKLKLAFKRKGIILIFNPFNNIWSTIPRTCSVPWGYRNSLTFKNCIITVVKSNIIRVITSLRLNFFFQAFTGDLLTNLRYSLYIFSHSFLASV